MPLSPAREFAFALHDVARLLRTYSDQRARELNMTRAQWAVLARLQRFEGVKQSELAEMLDLAADHARPADRQAMRARPGRAARRRPGPARQPAVPHREGDAHPRAARRARRGDDARGARRIRSRNDRRNDRADGSHQEQSEERIELQRLKSCRKPRPIPRARARLRRRRPPSRRGRRRARPRRRPRRPPRAGDAGARRCGSSCWSSPRSPRSRSACCGGWRAAAMSRPTTPMSARDKSLITPQATGAIAACPRRRGPARRGRRPIVRHRPGALPDRAGARQGAARRRPRSNSTICRSPTTPTRTRSGWARRRSRSARPISTARPRCSPSARAPRSTPTPRRRR